MNLYIRYFDDETLVYNISEALNFLASLGGINITEELTTELEKFLSSSAMYPKHIKVNARSFFIAIKTTANTMEEFKAKGSGLVRPVKSFRQDPYAEYAKRRPGWYEVKITFKRVVTLLELQKCRMTDTVFVAKLKADSIQDSYDRVVNYLRSRQDIDQRSQYPGIKNRNFEAKYLGEENVV